MEGQHFLREAWEKGGSVVHNKRLQGAVQADRGAQQAVARNCASGQSQAGLRKLSSRHSGGACLRAKYLKQNSKGAQQVSCGVPGGHVPWFSACRRGQAKQSVLKVSGAAARAAADFWPAERKLRGTSGAAAHEPGKACLEGDLTGGQGKVKILLHKCSLNHPTSGSLSWRLCLKVAGLRLARKENMIRPAAGACWRLRAGRVLREAIKQAKRQAENASGVQVLKARCSMTRRRASAYCAKAASSEGVTRHTERMQRCASGHVECMMFHERQCKQERMALAVRGAPSNACRLQCKTKLRSWW